jgi:hypothetical protein
MRFDVLVVVVHGTWNKYNGTENMYSKDRELELFKMRFDVLVVVVHGTWNKYNGTENMYSQIQISWATLWSLGGTYKSMSVDIYWSGHIDIYMSDTK